MPISVQQKWDAIQYNLKNGQFSNQDSTAVISYIVSGTDKDEEAIKAAYEQAPEHLKGTQDNIAGIPRRGVTIVERLQETVWLVQVNYAYADEEEEEDNDEERPEMSFEASGGTVHITQAYEQVCVFSADGHKDRAAEAEKVPIGWNGKTGEESEAAGVDVPEGQFSLTYKKIMSYTKATSTTWMRRVMNCYGRVNSKRFKGWEPGEVVFQACSFSTPMRGARKVAVTFNFFLRLNENNVRVAGARVGTVPGHWYCWAIYGDDPDSRGRKQIKKIYKARVHKESDFSVLGI